MVKANPFCGHDRSEQDVTCDPSCVEWLDQQSGRTLVPGAARRHSSRRCRFTDHHRPHSSSVLKNSSIKCLTSLADLAVHLHEIIWDGTCLILDRINLYIACIVKATGFTRSHIRQTTSSFQSCCPSDCDDGHFILGDLAGVGLCRWQVGRNFKSIILINSIILAHIEGNAVRGRRHRWDNQSKS